MKKKTPEVKTPSNYNLITWPNTSHYSHEWLNIQKQHQTKQDMNSKPIGIYYRGKKPSIYDFYFHFKFV